MKKIKVAAFALNQTPLDWDGNEQRILDAIKQARQEGVSLLCFPEMAICGYGCEDVFLAAYLYEECLESLQVIAQQAQGLAIAIGLPVMIDGCRYSASAFIVDGQVEGFYCKKNLAGDGLHYEPRWFSAWESGAVSSIEFAGRTVPAGDILFNVDNHLLAFEICEDAWVENRFAGNTQDTKPSFIINPSASHFAFQKHRERRQLVVDGAQQQECNYLYANMCSNESGRVIYDGSCMIATKDGLVAENERFSFHEVQMLTAVIETSTTKNISGNGIVDIAFTLPKITGECTPLLTTCDQLTISEEFLMAETLGLFDYMRKSFSKGFILSLSGGVDSACCAALVYAMVQRAVNELGIDGFKKRLGFFKEIQDKNSVKEIMHEMLCCVYQATENSGPVTENAAESLAVAIGAEYHFFNVDTVLNAYKSLVQGTMDRALSWKTDDLALQNIQARVRAPGIWMMTNLRGGLLITTSNRSEAAVGYATMDGDTCGSICPLGGVDKTFLRRWLHDYETNVICGCEPITALKFVNEQEPTAELRPQDQEQKDEEDLMPYDVLDFIEKASIRDKQSPRKIFHMLVDEYDRDKAQLFQWLEKFFVLWSRNQWKRERYAPAFHMDDENLDPKTWCRFPILSGSYKRELRRLKAEIGL